MLSKLMVYLKTDLKEDSSQQKQEIDFHQEGVDDELTNEELYREILLSS